MFVIKIVCLCTVGAAATSARHDPSCFLAAVDALYVYSSNPGIPTLRPHAPVVVDGHAG